MRATPLLRIIISLLLIAGFILPQSVHAAPAAKSEKESNVKTDGKPVLKASSAILTDTERNQVLYSGEPDKKLHIAALCKLMTILIALETEKSDSTVTISKDSIDNAQGSALSLEAGDKYPLEDLLNAIMLTSANDAANAVAENISGSIPDFVTKMNETAARLQMKDTKFTNPTGLYDENQYTTARDIAVFTKYAVTNPDFSRIFGIQAKPWYFKNGGNKILTSPNRLFWSYSGIDGGKTGYNTKDQQTVIATATRDGMQLICIILDSPEESVFTDAEALFNYGFVNFRKTRLVQKGETLKEVEAEDTKVSLVSGEDVYYVHPSGNSYIKGFNTSVDTQTPFAAGKIAGHARYILNDGTVVDVGLYPANLPLPPPDDFLTTAKKTLLEYRDLLIFLMILVCIEAVLFAINMAKLLRWVFRKLFRRSR